jgi:hypothetical protein
VVIAVAAAVKNEECGCVMIQNQNYDERCMKLLTAAASKALA